MRFDDSKKADEIFSLFGSLGVEDQKKVITELNNRNLGYTGKGGKMDIKL